MKKRTKVAIGAVAAVFIIAGIAGHGEKKPATPSSSPAAVSTPAPSKPAEPQIQPAKLETPEHEFSQSNTFDLFGKTDIGGEVVVTDVHGKVMTPVVTAQGTFTQTVKVTGFKDHEFTVTATKEGFAKASQKVIVTREQSEAEKLAQLKANAKTIPYKKLKKDADALAGQSVKLKGQVLEIGEKDGTTHMRIAVTKDSFGYNSNDVVYIEYVGHLDVYDEDVVTVYGKVYGNFSYKSQAGWDITVPAVIAQVVTK